VADVPVIALIDGEHHPSTVRDALDRLAAVRKLAGVVFCGGEEKVRNEVLEAPEKHYGRPVAIEADREQALRRLAGETDARAVVDLADEPVLPASEKLRLASLALHLGLVYEAPGTEIRVPRYERVDFDGPKLAVIGMGKRTGKTAIAGHWATLLRERDARPVIVSMGRGGPPDPQVAGADTSLEDLLAIVEAGRHAASDYLEDAVLARVPTVGCRRVGGGLAGEPFESNVPEGARLALTLDPGTLLFEGSGACLPPVQVDRTVCVVGPRAEALEEMGRYKLLRSELALVMHGDERLAALVSERWDGPVLRCELRPEPVERPPDGAHVAFFSTGARELAGVEPVLVSDNLARRTALEQDVERALAEGCDLFLTELKAAAIDTVAERARREGVALGLVRNRPVAIEGDLDGALVKLYDDA
jgi:cyclic 2,3-diphosphoglycerate synthase